MTNLTETSTWGAVPQLETTTQALGGPGGPMNAQAQALLNRTAWLKDNMPEPSTLAGPPGLSAYQVAVANGFVGTESEWLASLVGAQGLSAYAVAVANGFVGTESEWLASLIGPAGNGGGSMLITPDSPEAAPSPWDDHFQGAAIDTAGTRHAGALPWTVSGDIAAVPGGVIGTGAVQNRRMYLALGSVTDAVFCAKVFTGSKSSFTGLFAADSATGKTVVFGQNLVRGTDFISSSALMSYLQNNDSVEASNWRTSNNSGWLQGCIYIGLKITTTGVQYLFSQYGHAGTYMPIASMTYGEYGMNQPNQVGIIIKSFESAGDGSCGGAAWFKRTA